MLRNLLFFILLTPRKIKLALCLMSYVPQNTVFLKIFSNKQKQVCQMLYYTRLSRFLESKTSPSICPVNTHCKYSRKGHDMQNIPNLFDYRTIYFLR